MPKYIRLLKCYTPSSATFRLFFLFASYYQSRYSKTAISSTLRHQNRNENATLKPKVIDQASKQTQRANVIIGCHCCVGFFSNVEYFIILWFNLS